MAYYIHDDIVKKITILTKTVNSWFKLYLEVINMAKEIIDSVEKLEEELARVREAQRKF